MWETLDQCYSKVRLRNKVRGSPQGRVTQVLDCNIVESEGTPVILLYSLLD